jgi:tetratricopeptide (TPR) repeat protein
LHGFAQSSLSEAEKMNDAGFARHHPGGYEESLPLHDAAIRLEPDFALAWVNKGIALKNLSRIDEAIACYDHVIRKLDPEFKKAWHNKGVALRIDGRIEEAIECFDRAVEIDRHYAIAKRGRDECLAEKRNDRCVVDCPGVPREPAVLERIQMAGRLASQRNWLAAARMLENAGSGRTNSPCLSAQVGEWLFEGGDRRGSETHLRRALKLKLTCGVAWLNLTRCHLADGDLPAGLDAATRTTELIPEFSMAWANHAAALVALKRYSEAESSARKSLELDDRNGVALYNLGVSLRTQRRNAEARTALERFVTLCSDSPAVDSARDILSNL